MKTLLLNALLIFGLASTAFAQNNSVFAVHPNPIDTMNTADTYDTPAEGEISNISNDTIHLRWVRNIISLSPGITCAVCDPVTCWNTSIGTKDFSLGIDSSGQMTVHFYNEFFTPPPGQPGSGIVQIKITNLDNPVDTLTVLYTFSTLTATNEPAAPRVSLYPNPTTDFFGLEHAESVATMRLYTLDGREVARFENTLDNVYSIANQSIGNYILSFEDRNGRLFQAVEIQKR
jgi:hypothetical protein